MAGGGPRRLSGSGAHSAQLGRPANPASCEKGDRFASFLAFQPDLLFVESGGDNLAAQFSRDLADYTISVIDVSGRDKIPRKGGPGITQWDLLVINRTDLAPLVGTDLAVMDRDARKMRVNGPFIFAQVTNGVGVEEVVDRMLASAGPAALRPGVQQTKPVADSNTPALKGGPAIV